MVSRALSSRLYAGAKHGKRILPNLYSVYKFLPNTCICYIYVCTCMFIRFLFDVLFYSEAAVVERLVLWTGTNSTRIRTPSR